MDKLQETILEEAHSSRYSIHLSSTTMYHDLKRDIAVFVSKCSNYQQVEVEHQRPGVLAHNIELAEWNWEMVNMDFITGLPRSRR